MVSWCIGIDFGIKYWGLARGIYGIVEPIGSIAVVGGLPDWSKLHSLLKPWACETWVIGMPLASNGDLLLPGRVLKRHWNMIQKKLGGTLIAVDESLTTIEARAILLAQNVELTKENIDAQSACLILERFYDLYGSE